MTDIFERAKLYLPKYLTPAQQKELWEELRRFPTVRSFYLPTDDDRRVLQGDGWHGLVVINFDSMQRRTVAGLVVSNSCDIAPENQSALATNVVFAPLISLSRYREALEKAGQTATQVADVVDTIRRQEVTYLFHLPEGPYGVNESVVCFDDLHSHPAHHFLSNERTRLFRLSQVAFYVLLLKLSIHFCRFQEGVPRFAA